MEKKLRVGILGGTGMVGQRFISLLEDHPWFQVVAIAASPRSAGLTYEEAVGSRWKMTKPMPEQVKKIVVMNVNEVEKVAAQVDFVFSAVDMTKEEIRAIEDAYAKTETPVVSNNSAHRWTPDVPMVVPEINPEHFAVIEHQRKRLGTQRGFVAVNQTAPSRVMRRCLLHGKNLSRPRWLQLHTRRFPALEKLLRTGRKWWKISFLTSAARKKRASRNLFVCGAILKTARSLKLRLL